MLPGICFSPHSSNCNAFSIKNTFLLVKTAVALVNSSDTVVIGGNKWPNPGVLYHRLVFFTNYTF